MWWFFRTIQGRDSVWRWEALEWFTCACNVRTCVTNFVQVCVGDRGASHGWHGRWGMELTCKQNKTNTLWCYIDGLAQDCSISIAKAMEILQSCDKPSICSGNSHAWQNMIHGFLMIMANAIPGVCQYQVISKLSIDILINKCLCYIWIFTFHCNLQAAFPQKKVFEISYRLMANLWKWEYRIEITFMSRNAVYFDGLVQERRNSITNALELRLSCTNPSIYVDG